MHYFFTVFVLNIWDIHNHFKDFLKFKIKPISNTVYITTNEPVFNWCFMEFRGYKKITKREAQKF